MRDRPATRSGYRPIIWCLLMIAALLGAYAVVRPVLALMAHDVHVAARSSV